MEIRASLREAIEWTILYTLFGTTPFFAMPNKFGIALGAICYAMNIVHMVGMMFKNPPIEVGSIDLIMELSFKKEKK